MFSNNLLAGASGQGGVQLFNAIGYTGDGSSSRSITGVGFQPDFVWVRNYTDTASHNLYDSVRGINLDLFSNLTNAESDRTGSGGSLVSFDGDGFGIGADAGSSTGLNLNAKNYIAWCFKAGGSASSNTDGAITSSVSANVDAGFSVATYTGNASTGTIGHGLSAEPELVIIKNRGTASNWFVGSPLLNTGYYLLLNSDAAKTYYNDGSGGSFFNYSGWSSSVVNIYDNNSTSINSTSYSFSMLAFHSVDGYSKIGTYTGNGGTNTITTGFQPSFVMAKRVNTTGNWTIADDVRTTGGSSHFLYPNLTNTQSISTVTTMTSTGFELSGAGGDYNASGSTYLYIALA